MNLTKWASVLIATSLSLSCAHAVFAEDSNEKFAESQQTAPDNTTKNKRDKKLHKQTAENQSNSKSDVDLTAKVRRAIMSEKGMSTDGQNVKIVTVNGVITLRGPVNSEAEKELIGKLAKDSGAKAITNQLEPKKQ